MNRFWKLCVLLLFSVVIVAVQHYPTLYAYLHTPEGYYFSGQASWYDPWDINVYVTAIKFGQSKHILLKNLYTTGSKPQTLMYPLYTMIGYVFSANPYLLFHIAAAIVGFGICFLLFYLYKREIKSFWITLSAVIVCSVGGGLGWFSEYTYQSAGSSITSFNFASIFQRSHEGIGTMLYVTAMYTSYLYFKDQKIKKFNYIALICLFFLIFFYPYYLLSYFLIVGLYVTLSIYKTKKYKDGLFLIINTIIIGCLTFLYYMHLRSTDFLAAISEDLASVNLISMLLGYSNFIIFFIVDAFLQKKKRNLDLEKYLLIWIALSIVLSYIPFFGFSRFYLRGLFFPLTLLLFLRIEKYKENYLLPIIIPVLVLIFSLARINIFNQRIAAVYDKNNKWYYLSENIIEGFNFLSERKKDGVLSYYILSNFIPAYTNKSVYFGHFLQTPSAVDRVTQVQAFYRGQMDEETASAFLRDNKIHFILYAKFDGTYQGHVYDFLEHRFENEDLKIYSVKRPITNEKESNIRSEMQG